MRRRPPRSPRPTYPTAIYSRLPEMSQQHHLAPHQPSPHLQSSPGGVSLPSGQLVEVTHPATGIRQVWPKPRRVMSLLPDGSPVAAAYFCLLHRKFKRRRKRRSERKGISADLLVILRTFCAWDCLNVNFYFKRLCWAVLLLLLFLVLNTDGFPWRTMKF